MAPLAIDALRQPILQRGREDILVRAAQVYLICRRVSIMAADALEVYRTAEVLLVRRVVTGAHCPDAALLAVPAYGQFQQLALGREVKVTARMIAGADGIVHRHPLDIRPLAIPASLRALYEVSAILLPKCVGTIRGTVINRAVAPKVFHVRGMI